MALDASYRRIARVRLASRRNLSRGHALCRSANGLPSPGSNLGWPYPAGCSHVAHLPQGHSRTIRPPAGKIVSKRFVKKQQMQWTSRGAHLLLQTRTKVLTHLATSFTLVPAVSRSCRLTPDFLMLSENASKHEAADDTALTIRHMLLLSHSSEHMPAIPKERSRERGRDSCKRSDRSYRGRRH